MDGDHEEAMRQRMAFFFLQRAGACDGNFLGRARKIVLHFALHL